MQRHRTRVHYLSLQLQLVNIHHSVQAAVFQVTSILGAGLVLFMSRGEADGYDDGYTAF